MSNKPSKYGLIRYVLRLIQLCLRLVLLALAVLGKAERSFEFVVLIRVGNKSKRSFAIKAKATERV